MQNNMRDPLNGAMRKKLRALAHHLDPVVMIGQKGMTPQVIEKTRSALDAHELIKVRFTEFKKEKRDLSVD